MRHSRDDKSCMQICLWQVLHLAWWVTEKLHWYHSIYLNHPLWSANKSDYENKEFKLVNTCKFAERTKIYRNAITPERQGKYAWSIKVNTFKGISYVGVSLSITHLAWTSILIHRMISFHSYQNHQHNCSIFRYN